MEEVSRRNFIYRSLSNDIGGECQLQIRVSVILLVWIKYICLGVTQQMVSEKL